MEDTAKYLIHARVSADGVVERSDVVGAIFGQTEGLLGDELDLRDLRDSQKVGRIDVDIDASGGRSRGSVTIATDLDKVETATLAAALETITRVGPCRATLQVEEIEDTRSAKRKAVVERAKELLRTGFEDTVMSSEEILTAVREHVRVEDVTEYSGLPAGPRVADGDAIIVVEGRADVLTLLKYGVKNAIAVEGTNVPDPVADLTRERTVTAFLDGDRGGELILEELAQVGDVDFVAFAPSGTAVEDLDHHALFRALREKVPYDAVAEVSAPRDVVAATDGSATPAPAPGHDANSAVDDVPTTPGDIRGTQRAGERARSVVEEGTTIDAETATSDDAEAETRVTETLVDHVDAIVRDSETDAVRLLGPDETTIAEAPAAEAADVIEAADPAPTTVVLDGVLTQQLLDVAAERGVERIVARRLGQFTKQPTGVRIHAADAIADPP